MERSAEALEKLTEKQVQTEMGNAVLESTPPDFNWATFDETRWDILENLTPRKWEKSSAILTAFFVHGRYDLDGKAAAGIWFELVSTAMILVFVDSYRYAEGTISPDALLGLDRQFEREILLHETGHALGLVNNGAPMVHPHVDQTDSCLCHSDNPSSVMYTSRDLPYYLDRRMDRLTGEEAYFDSDDLADLRAHQEELRQRYG